MNEWIFMSTYPAHIDIVGWSSYCSRSRQICKSTAPWICMSCYRRTVGRWRHPGCISLSAANHFRRLEAAGRKLRPRSHVTACRWRSLCASRDVARIRPKSVSRSTGWRFQSAFRHLLQTNAHKHTSTLCFGITAILHCTSFPVGLASL